MANPRTMNRGASIVRTELVAALDRLIAKCEGNDERDLEKDAYLKVKKIVRGMAARASARPGGLGKR